MHHRTWLAVPRGMICMAFVHLDIGKQCNLSQAHTGSHVLLLYLAFLQQLLCALLLQWASSCMTLSQPFPSRLQTSVQRFDKPAASQAHGHTVKFSSALVCALLVICEDFQIPLCRGQ